VRTVAVAIGVVTVNLVGGELGAALELRVRDINTGVNNVGADTLPSTVIVGVRAAPSILIRDTS
jgi:hypothetical protein